MPYVLIICLIAIALIATGAWADHPVLPPGVTAADLDGTRRAVADVMALSEEDMVALIPEQSGIYFTDCPNCDEGIQEGQFAPRNGAKYAPWEISNPLAMRCTYCGHQYPSEKFPMTEKLYVDGPNGWPEVYPYWADASGYRHFFGARIDDLRIRYMESTALRLAQAYHLTGEAQYARRCALVLYRFAEVYGKYCYHFDYPFQDKVIYSGRVEPEDFRPGFRTARWSWWAYMDLPDLLVRAYDLIHESPELDRMASGPGHDPRGEIDSFLIAAAEQVLANEDDLSNMSPGMWADVIRAGRVLGDAGWVHTAVGRLNLFLGTEFFHDGAWCESAPAYNAQVTGNLEGVYTAAAGYTDPARYKGLEDGVRFDNLDLREASPAASRARDAFSRMRLPNGRLMPLHDTWAKDWRSPLERAEPFLLPGMGLGCLAGGAGDGAWQTLLTWSPGGGHEHWDGLGLILFGQGQELLSDLGYTHSRDRAWTLPTAAHNTVVIDQKNQDASLATFGSLRYFAAYPECQVVSADNPQVYPGLAGTYRRTVITLAPVNGVGGYVVDLFEVNGGQQHDYFLHGCADVPGTATVTAGGGELAMSPLDTLLPAGSTFVEARDEGECGISLQGAAAYGYLRDLRSAAVTDPVTTVTFATTEPATRLEAHLLTAPGDQLVVGRNPAIRGAGENDANLRDYWRPFMMLRRSGGTSVFASVIGPLLGQGQATVSRLDAPDADLALTISAPGQQALVMLRPRGDRAIWQGQPVTAAAELAVVWTGASRGGLAVAGSLDWGGTTIAADPTGHHALLAVDRAASRLTVAGSLLPIAGSTITLDHAGQRTSAYTVVASGPAGANSVLTVREDPGFDWDAATSTANYTCQPHATYRGAHTVSLTPIAYFHASDNE